ncbi:MAG: radical SAM protein [archaeon]
MNILLLIPPNKKGFIRDVYYGCWHRRKFLSYSWPPIGLYQLAAILDEHAVLILDGTILGRGHVVSAIRAFRPDVIVLGSGTFTMDDDLEFLKSLKCSAPVIMYGECTAGEPAECLRRGADYVIRGEPEAVVADLIGNLESPRFLKGLDGVCFGRHISKKTALVSNLDSLPVPKRPLADAPKYSNPLAISAPFTTMLVSRGCPYSCSFCTVPLVYGSKYRRRSVGSVIGELSVLQKEGYREILFRDENLTLDGAFILALCKKMAEMKPGLTWICNSRADTVNGQVIRAMRKAGCHLVKFGVESGNDTILKKINKRIAVSQIRRAFQLCHDEGVGTLAHFIIGNPGDTDETIGQTIEFAIELDPLYASFDVFLRYPNSPIDDADLCQISPAGLRKWHDLAFRRFYLRPRLLAKHILAAESFSMLVRRAHDTAALWLAFLRGRRSPADLSLL